MLEQSHRRMSSNFRSTQAVRSASRLKQGWKSSKISVLRISATKWKRDVEHKMFGVPGLGRVFGVRMLWFCIWCLSKVWGLGLRVFCLRGCSGLEVRAPCHAFNAILTLHCPCSETCANEFSSLTLRCSDCMPVLPPCTTQLHQLHASF